jgi:hypothetical protein
MNLQAKQNAMRTRARARTIKMFPNPVEKRKEFLVVSICRDAAELSRIEHDRTVGELQIRAYQMAKSILPEDKSRELMEMMQC